MSFKNQDYRKLKSSHNQTRLFEDPEFPAIDKTIYHSKMPPQGVRWMRPWVNYCRNRHFYFCFNFFLYDFIIGSSS